MGNIDQVIEIFAQVKSGGHIFLSFMDGQLLFNKLQKQNIDIYDTDEENRNYQKYFIEKLYQENIMLPAEQFISVKLPFS